MNQESIKEVNQSTNNTRHQCFGACPPGVEMIQCVAVGHYSLTPIHAVAVDSDDQYHNLLDAAAAAARGVASRPSCTSRMSSGCSAVTWRAPTSSNRLRMTPLNGDACTDTSSRDSQLKQRLHFNWVAVRSRANRVARYNSHPWFVHSFPLLFPRHNVCPCYLQRLALKILYFMSVMIN